MEIVQNLPKNSTRAVLEGAVIDTVLDKQVAAVFAKYTIFFKIIMYSKWTILYTYSFTKCQSLMQLSAL